MKTFKYYILVLLLTVGVKSLYGQISIPYGNDAILNDDTARIDLRFELDGRDWDCRYVTYIFLNGTNDIAGNEEHDAVRRAFASWSSATNLDFIEACNENDADIRIAWEVDNHGDPCDDPEDCFFDGEGGTLAHGFFPPPNTGPFAGDIHFDDDENWSLTSDIDMQTVALHEIGHAIGLRHSDVNDAVMEAFYEGRRRRLTVDDRDGIQTIYGVRSHPIIGPNWTCSDTATYELDEFECLSAVLNIDSIEWRVSSNSMAVISGIDSNIVTIVSPTSSAGNLEVVIHHECGEILFSREIGFGKPLKPQIHYDIPWCDDALIIWFDDDFLLQPGTKIVWETWNELFGYEIWEDTRRIEPDFMRGTYRYRLTLTNDCGSTTVQGRITREECDREGEYFIVLPNPTSSELLIEFNSNLNFNLFHWNW